MKYLYMVGSKGAVLLLAVSLPDNFKHQRDLWFINAIFDFLVFSVLFDFFEIAVFFIYS